MNNTDKEIVEQNKKLCQEYPFLKPKWAEDDFDYTWTELDNIPKGWRIAFGDLFCRDLKKALELEFPDGIPNDFYFIDIKEKWGALRLCMPYESGHIKEFMHKYEYISQYVCIECGVPYPFAHMTYHGWVQPMCEKCFLKQNKHLKHEDYMQTILRDLDNVKAGPKKVLTIKTYGPDNTSSSYDINIRDTWNEIVDKYVERTLI